MTTSKVANRVGEADALLVTVQVHDAAGVEATRSGASPSGAGHTSHARPKSDKT